MHEESHHQLKREKEEVSTIITKRIYQTKNVQKCLYHIRARIL